LNYHLLLLIEFILQKWLLISLLKRKLVVFTFRSPIYSWSFFSIISVFLLLVAHIFILFLRTVRFWFVWFIIFIFLFRVWILLYFLSFQFDLLFRRTLLFPLTSYFFGCLTRLLINGVFVFVLIFHFLIICIIWILVRLASFYILVLDLSLAHLFQLLFNL
jgi:hypothetical protein